MINLFYASCYALGISGLLGIVYYINSFRISQREYHNTGATTTRITDKEFEQIINQCSEHVKI